MINFLNQSQTKYSTCMLYSIHFVGRVKYHEYISISALSELTIVNWYDAPWLYVRLVFSFVVSVCSALFVCARSYFIIFLNSLLRYLVVYVYLKAKVRLYFFWLEGSIFYTLIFMQSEPVVFVIVIMILFQHHSRTESIDLLTCNWE